ncbi:UDP-N-acetylglucosamine acyltransferase [Zavarzinia compransoris]|uniref:UDP-N-acetylglucosamine acyltransferase n=1 Tax=Zavarzinia compransoris TaxID=1264899 RepID=A0A317DZ43_9PROT|nr:UDP-N-acetylglucosamine acyltransferase [Zavarzinia compransoris]PWR19692.1 UDP-N-acetylglucosamine acyltransferase [Zavarzinia compransoris]TDP43362.1 hypothetical protein DES42_11263 [Zavarzinia compransoris]
MMRLVFVILAAAFLAACHATPPLNFTVTELPAVATRFDAELKSVSVTPAGEGEKQGSIDFLDAQVPSLWQSAINDAASRLALFNDDAATKLSLTVTILQFDIPSMGFDMSTDVAARYDLIDRATGAVIDTYVAANTGTVPMDYDFVGVTRAMESINRAVKANIRAYLDRLVASPPPLVPAKVPAPAAIPPKAGS